MQPERDLNNSQTEETPWQIKSNQPHNSDKDSDNSDRLSDDSRLEMINADQNSLEKEAEASQLLKKNHENLENGDRNKWTWDVDPIYKKGINAVNGQPKGSNATPEKEPVDEVWEHQHLRYGWGSWKPECAQVFNSIRWYVFWTCVFSLFQGFIVNGVINAIISTLEKRFELPSSKSGLIASSNDFLAFFLVLVISYYGGRRNKPLMIGVGVFVLGLGSFIFSFPHFTAGKYNYKSSDVDDFENICRNDTADGSCQVGESKSHLQKYLYVFMLGNALHGAGSTPMFTLGTTFIDENSRPENTPLFLGFIYAAASIGVAAGYMIGGQFLNIYTDVDRVDMKEVSINPSDPRWVGAWWISFLISGTVMFVVALPMIAYPKRLPGSAALQLQRKSEACSNATDSAVMDKSFGKSWRDFPKAMWNLIRNPTFLFLSLGTCTEGMIVSGIATFGAKFLQEKFNLPAALASFVMGIITVPGAGGGMLLGGVIVKKAKLKCRGIIRMNLIVAAIALICGLLFLLQCPAQKIAGVTSDYVTGSERHSPNDLSHQCNSECGCSEMVYEPVCGMDGQIYFTPCHAGCNNDTEMMMGPMGPFTMYKNCACVQESIILLLNTSMETEMLTTTVTTETLISSTEFYNATNQTGPPPPGAFQGICMSDCKLLYLVAPLLFVGMLLTFTTVSPLQTATLRCVQPNQRALAIGFQWLFLRLLGTTPGPVMLGTIMDSACNVWQDLCGKAGSCWIYEKTDMGIRLFIWWCLVKSFGILFYFAAQYFYEPSPETEEDKKEEKSDDDKKKLMKEIEALELRESVI